MRFVTNYKELGGDSSESIHEHLMKNAIEQKERVLNYMYNGKDNGIRCAGVFDYVTNEPKFDTIRLYTDGSFYWDSEEIYHFENYNLALNTEFIEHVLNQ